MRVSGWRVSRFSIRKLGWAILGLCLFALACSGSASLSERLLDIDASETVCAPRGEPSQSSLLTRLTILPGERIRFRVYNNSSDLMEFILTDEAGLALRYEKLQPGIRIIDPAQVSLDALRQAPLTAGELAAADLAHDGHEDEYGPDATEDYQYRMIVDPQSVRNMLVTFPEVAEGYALNKAICAHPDSLEQIVVAEISRR